MLQIYCHKFLKLPVSNQILHYNSKCIRITHFTSCFVSDLAPDYSDDESRSPRDSHMILGEQDDEISKYTGLIQRGNCVTIR